LLFKKLNEINYLLCTPLLVKGGIINLRMK
jgi:hypothetical protein